MAKIKTASVRIKAAGEGNGLDPGQFEAIVSVFGNKDLYGDIMMPGAFTDTLAAWKDSGDPIPVIWSHDWSDPISHIGVVLDAREVDAGEFGDKSPAGLWVKGQNDVDTNPRAAQVQKLLNGRRVRQFSFAFDELSSGYGKHEGQEGWLIHKVDLFEVGPTLIGANQSTDLLGAKRVIIDLATHFKAGSRHSADDMAHLRGIHDALGSLGVPCEPDDGKSHQDGTGKSGATDPREGREPAPTPIPVKSPAGPSALDLDLILAELDLDD